MNLEIFKYLPEAKCILDIGCGENEPLWYHSAREDAEINGIDLLKSPNINKPNFSYFRMDALMLDSCSRPITITEVRGGVQEQRIIQWYEKFDLVVAYHVFEHVSDPARLARGISMVTKKGASVHIGIPDPFNFTERLYHLIHPEGGGHISQIAKDEMIAIMADNGFVLTKFNGWPDDWEWLRKLYDWKGRGIKYFTGKDLDYIADTFVKELTPEKGYFYGGEYVFEKMASFSKMDKPFEEGNKPKYLEHMGLHNPVTDSNIAQLRQLLSEKDAEIEKLRNSLAQVYNSKTWKLGQIYGRVLGERGLGRIVNNFLRGRPERPREK